MLPYLADRMVLCPSRNAIPSPDKTRRIIPHAGGELEVWVQPIAPAGRPEPAGQAEPELFVLKLNGAGGRAERTGTHPLEYWTDLPAEIWSLNPPGYGGSAGRASLTRLAPAARAALAELERVARGRPILVTGNSLGTTTALHLAAHCQVAGLILRNPPPLTELIAGYYARWAMGMSRLVAAQIPPELDSIRNAARARLPAVFVTCGRDRVVPPAYQQRVIASYGGAKRVVSSPLADHADPLDQSAEPAYLAALDWLRAQVLQQ
jgi:pimeloyl-ACP methyl ester carboxylesterase